MWYSSTRSHMGQQSGAQGLFYIVRLFCGHRKTSLWVNTARIVPQREAIVEGGLLRDIEVNRDLIVIAGMGGIVLDVFLGNHAHLQERTEDKGVIVKDGLLLRMRPGKKRA